MRGSERRHHTTSSPDPLTLPLSNVPIDSGTVRAVPDRDVAGAYTLYVNDVPSSYYNPHDPTDVGFEYLEIMQAAIATLPGGPLHALHLGAAGCTLARSIAHTRPRSRQLAVDLDHSLTVAVRSWFTLPRSPELKLRSADARTALASRPDGSADVIIRDAFHHDRTPSHLATVEFDHQVARVLRPHGIYLANIADKPPLTLVRDEVRTAAAAFGDGAEVAIVAEPAVLRGRRYGNMVLVVQAGVTPDHPGVLDSATFQRALRTFAVPMRLLRLGADPDIDALASHGRVVRDAQPWSPSPS